MAGRSSQPGVAGRPGWVDLVASECPNDCPIDTISKKKSILPAFDCFDAACFVRSGTFLSCLKSSIYPFAYSHIGVRVSHPPALLAGLRFALPCAPTAFALTKNYAQGHSLALSLGLGAFFRSTWPARPRFCSPGRPLGRSRARFFDVFRSYLSLEVNIARHQQNTGRSGTKRISGLPRIEPKTLKFRSTSAFVRVRHSAHLQQASGELSESVLGMPGAFLERSWMPRGDPESALGGPGCAFSRSRGVPAAPRSIPAATRIALNRPRSIFRRFVVDFSSIWG